MQLMSNSLWILVGLLSFFILEKLFPDEEISSEETHANPLNISQSIKVTYFKVHSTKLFIIIIYF